MSVVPTITVNGKTYTVTWAADQRTNTSNKVNDSDGSTSFSMIKPVIKDSKRKVVKSVTSYVITQESKSSYINGASYESGASMSFVTPESQYSNIGWSDHILATVAASVRVDGITRSIGTATLLNTRIGCTFGSLLFRQVFLRNDDTPVPSNVTRLSVEANIQRYDNEAGNEDLLDNLNAFSVLVQYRESGTSKVNPWINASISDVDHNGDRIATDTSYNSSFLTFNVELPNTKAGKIYEIRFSPKVSVGTENSSSSNIKLWVTRKFTSRALFDNVIAVGDELVAPQQNGTVFNLASLISGIGFGDVSANVTPGFSPSTTTLLKYKNGAKVEDMSTLIRSIPKQSSSKNTLLLVSIGMHNVLKVSPDKMIASATFKTLLKNAISSFLTNNPNATVALFAPPEFTSFTSNQEEVDALDDLLTDGTYQAAWDQYATNILGSTTPQWIKELAAGKLSAFYSAMFYICQELNKADRKRVILIQTSINSNTALEPLKPGHLGYWTLASLAVDQLANTPSSEKPFGPDKFHLNAKYVYNKLVNDYMTGYLSPINGRVDLPVVDIVY